MLAHLYILRGVDFTKQIIKTLVEMTHENLSKLMRDIYLIHVDGLKEFEPGTIEYDYCVMGIQNYISFQRNRKKRKGEICHLNQLEET